MATPEIKAKLVLETDSGVGGGGGSPFSVAEERVFRQEERKANQTTSKFMPLMGLGGIKGILGVGAIGVFKKLMDEVANAKNLDAGGPGVIAEFDYGEALKNLFDGTNDETDAKNDLNDASERNKIALEELEAQGISTAGGLLTLKDGSIVAVDELGNAVAAFGGGMAAAQLQVESTEGVFKALNIEANALVKAMISANNDLAKNFGGVEFRNGQGFSTRFGSDFNAGKVSTSRKTNVFNEPNVFEKFNMAQKKAKGSSNKQ